MQRFSTRFKMAGLFVLNIIAKGETTMSLFGKKVEQDSLDNDLPKSKPRAKGKYTIEDATLLMRTLPVDKHPELVILVLKNTLKSMNVNLKDIIDDANVKEEAANREIVELKETIAKLEEETARRKQELAEMEANLAEAIGVKGRLVAAVAQDEATIPLTSGKTAIGAEPSTPSAP